jgi:hypothetical protein
MAGEKLRLNGVDILRGINNKRGHAYTFDRLKNLFFLSR